MESLQMHVQRDGTHIISKGSERLIVPAHKTAAERDEMIAQYFGTVSQSETGRVWPDGEAFLLSFTLEEQIGIALSTHPIIAALRLRLAARKTEIWASDPLVILGLTTLVQAGIITEERKTFLVLGS